MGFGAETLTAISKCLWESANSVLDVVVGGVDSVLSWGKVSEDVLARNKAAAAESVSNYLNTLWPSKNIMSPPSVQRNSWSLILVRAAASTTISLAWGLVPTWGKIKSFYEKRYGKKDDKNLQSIPWKGYSGLQTIYWVIAFPGKLATEYGAFLIHNAFWNRVWNIVFTSSPLELQEFYNEKIQVWQYADAKVIVNGVRELLGNAASAVVSRFLAVARNNRASTAILIASIALIAYRSAKQPRASREKRLSLSDSNDANTCKSQRISAFASSTNLQKVHSGTDRVALATALLEMAVAFSA